MAHTADAEAPTLLAPAAGCFVRQEVDNIGWIDLGDHVVVVDALERPELEAEVIAAIDSTCGGKPVRNVVNTHTHYDHIALNGAFSARFGASILSIANHAVPSAGLSWTGAGRRVEVRPAAGCHTDEDLVVWLPRQRILFVGDIFGWGLIPWDRPLDRARLDHIVATYERLAGLEPETVVPGHGPLCTAAELRRWVRYIGDLVTRVQGLCREGMDRRAIASGVVPPPEDMRSWWRFLQWKHADSVAKIAQAVIRGRL